MKDPMDQPLSTVAMTLYNCLQLYRKPATATELRMSDVVRAHCQPDEAAATAALDELVGLDRLSVTVTLGERTYTSRDPLHGLVMKRNRDDHGEDDEGNITGGWGGWEVSRGAIRIPIEEAIR